MAPALSQPLLLFCQAILLGMAAAAGGLQPGGFAGIGGSPAVRSAAGLPPAAAPPDVGAGHPVLHGRGLGGLPLHAPPGAGAAAAVSAAGGGGRRCAVFHRLLPVFAAGVGFLGGYPGIFAASDRHSPAGSGKFV